MSPTRSARRTGPLLIVLVLFAAAAAGMGGLWYLFFRPAGPAPVSLASLPPALPSATAGSSADPGPSANGGQPVGAGDIAGTWTVDPSIGTLDDASGSFVGYRVQEQLATVGATEAVGRTSSVTGSITIEGTSVTAAAFTADLTTLHSDESNRDRQLSTQALQTSQFPTATFTLTQPIELGSVPADGVVVEVTATGDLTLHGVTGPVRIPLQARLHAGLITIAGSLPITFSDWSIQPPQAMIVLSVDNKGTMELQLQLTKS